MLLIDTAHVGHAASLSFQLRVIRRISLSLLKLREEVLGIRVLPLALLKVVGHAKGQIQVALQLTVFTLLGPHLIDDHRTQNGVMLFNARGFNVVRIVEIGRLEVQARSRRHQVHYHLYKALLFEGINDMLVRLHVSMNELHLLELEVELFLKQVFKHGNPVNQRKSLLTLRINQVLMLGNVV